MVVYSVNFYYTTASESSSVERHSYNFTTRLHHCAKRMRNILFNWPMFHLIKFSASVHALRVVDGGYWGNHC